MIAALQCNPPPFTPGQALAAAGLVILSVMLLFTILWTVLRFTLPGEEKILTDVLRRRKA